MSIVFFTGAGISTESGIPDYRGPDGVWTRDPEAEKLATWDHYVSDADIRRRSWLHRRDHAAWDARPNAGHRAVAGCADAYVITQNVDGLHGAAGTPAERVAEVHGSMRHTVCIACGARGDTAEFVQRVVDGEADPRCPECGGIVKTGTVMFGEALDPVVFERATEWVLAASTVIAVGTTLQVYPAAGLVALAADAGVRLIVVNAEPTPFDRQAEQVIREPIGVALPALCAREGWLA